MLLLRPRERDRKSSRAVIALGEAIVCGESECTDVIVVPTQISSVNEGRVVACSSRHVLFGLLVCTGLCVESRDDRVTTKQSRPKLS